MTHKTQQEAAHGAVEIFERSRARLLGIAYRILGSRAEAEDAVQDTFLRWLETDIASVRSPAAWLTATCTRRAIDMLRAAYRSRVDYVGNWLPEPVQTDTGHDAEAQMDLASSLSTAFLLMLERLTPKERAAYLLHDIFEMPYANLAGTLDMSEPACRKLVSRARTRIGEGRMRYRPSRERQQELLAAFETAIRTGEAQGLTKLLASDVRLTADGGGIVKTLADVLSGEAVPAFLTELLHVWWADYDWRLTELNGTWGATLSQRGEIVAAASFSYDASDRVSDIFIMRNPGKLARLGADGVR